MKILYVFAISFVLSLSCANSIVSLDNAADIETGDDILELHGKPDHIEITDNNLEIWKYCHWTYNLFELESIQGEYQYTLTRQGAVIKKNVQIANTRYSLMPIKSLPPEFIDFE